MNCLHALTVGLVPGLCNGTYHLDIHSVTRFDHKVGLNACIVVTPAPHMAKAQACCQTWSAQVSSPTSTRAGTRLTSALLTSLPSVSWQKGFRLGLHTAVELLAVGLSEGSIRILALRSCIQPLMLRVRNICIYTCSCWARHGWYGLRNDSLDRSSHNCYSRQDTGTLIVRTSQSKQAVQLI